ncbi:hypothetical protein [Raineyella fluvialis]|uniref:Uncharacterized protein n=1 Tax=Raineyella fluvialis TaxID=2662261 RepID=A0A5Q2F6T6_9ACTN|nr:hypothetical protein [Raineyella fluvialis]QGF22702.1 hypothetical protein Rai3103_02290 [Raineyella fluvialis]
MTATPDADVPSASDPVVANVWYDRDEDAVLGLFAPDGSELSVAVTIGDRWPTFGRLLTLLAPHLVRSSVRGFLEQLEGAGMRLDGYTAHDLADFERGRTSGS